VKTIFIYQSPKVLLPEREKKNGLMKKLDTFEMGLKPIKKLILVINYLI
jgi:hypothetical protein